MSQRAVEESTLNPVEMEASPSWSCTALITAGPQLVSPGLLQGTGFDMGEFLHKDGNMGNVQCWAILPGEQSAGAEGEGLGSKGARIPAPLYTMDIWRKSMRLWAGALLLHVGVMAEMATMWQCGMGATQVLVAALKGRTPSAFM